MTSNPDDKSINDVFNDLDEDGDNCIDMDELKSFLQGLFRKKIQEIEKYIEEL